MISSKQQQILHLSPAVTDLGFSTGDRNSGGRCVNYILHFFCEKLHENEKNWTESGLDVPPDPPLSSGLVHTQRLAITVWVIVSIVSLPVTGRRKTSTRIYALISVISGYLLGATRHLASVSGLGTRLIVVCLVPGWDYVFRRFELHCPMRRTEPSTHLIRDISELAVWLVAPETALIPVILHRKHTKVVTKRASESSVVKTVVNKNAFQ